MNISFKDIPGLRFIYHSIRHRFESSKFQGVIANDVFNKIYRNSSWGGEESASGRGSDFDQTKIVVRELPQIFHEYGIKSILDIPCGDFHWMKEIDLGGIRYVGGDIVNDIVLENQLKYASDSISFECLDLMTSRLPASDLVLCRDCLVHLSFKDINEALKNICKSGSTYLLTTTFFDRKLNRDIVTGRWRPINLQSKPFLFPEPFFLLNEECPQDNGKWYDKSLALWRIEDVSRVVSFV